MKEAQFSVDVAAEAARLFAELSGDWNPLHTDADYAATTHYGQPILHGAFSAGLVSRLAGMELPGRECLLLNMRLRFVAPIFPRCSFPSKERWSAKPPIWAVSRLQSPTLKPVRCM